MLAVSQSFRVQKLGTKKGDKQMIGVLKRGWFRRKETFDLVKHPAADLCHDPFEQAQVFDGMSYDDVDDDWPELPCANSAAGQEQLLEDGIAAMG